MSSKFIFIPEIGNCTIDFYLDIFKPVAKITDAEIYLIVSKQTNKLTGNHILTKYTPIPYIIREHSENFLMIQVLHPGQYICINGISEYLPFEIVNGIYKIIYINKIVSCIYIKDIEYFIENVQNGKKIKLNINNFDLSFISVINPIEHLDKLIDKKPPIGNISSFLYNQRHTLDNSFKLIGQDGKEFPVHMDIISATSKFIKQQQFYNNSFLLSTTSNYTNLKSDKSIEMFIYLIYHFSLSKFSLIDSINLEDIYELLEISSYYNLIDELSQYIHQLIPKISASIKAEILVSDYGKLIEEIPSIENID